MLLIDDVITNRSFRPVNHAIIYHLNFGYPFLDKSLEIAGLPEPLHSSFKSDPRCRGTITANGSTSSIATRFRRRVRSC